MKTMNEENNWDQMIDKVFGPICKVTGDKMIKAAKRLKLEKAVGSSEVNTEVIVATDKIGVKDMMELCKHVLDGIENPNE